MLVNKKHLLRAILILVTLFAGALPAGAAEGSAKVVLIAVEGLTIEDINSVQLPFITDKVRSGAVALMNTKTAGGYSREHSFTSLGAGRPAVGSRDSGLAFSVEEEYQGLETEKIYGSRVGRQAPEDGAVLLTLPHVLEGNRRQKTGADAGLLAETLQQGGQTAAVIGNGDIPGEYHREAVSMVMDRWGRVEQAAVDRSLLTPGRVLLWRTDFDRLLQEANKYSQADVLLIETGDLTRLELLKADLLPEVWAEERVQALKRIDHFVSQLAASSLFDNAVFVFFSHQPAGAALNAKNFFTPIVVWGTDLKGWLTSGTTRRAGVVTGTDLTVSILHWLGLAAPQQMTGRLFSDREAEEPIARLTALNSRAVFVYRARPPLVKGYVFSQIAVISLALLGLLLQRRLVSYLKPVLLGLTAVPAGLLLVVLVPTLSFSLYLAALLAIILLIVWMSLRVSGKKMLAPFVMVSMFSVIVILADLLLGAPLMKHSTLGYDAMAGARYYGIGNEYMGVLVGAACIGTAGIYQRYRRGRAWLPAVIAAFYLLIITAVGAPQLGTNFGGTLSALAAFAFLTLALSRRSYNYRTVLLTAVIAVIVVLLLAAYDYLRPPDVQSHLGRTARLVIGQGPGVLADIAFRKLAMNIKLIKWTIWSRVFLVLLAALAVLSFKPAGAFKHFARQYPYFQRGLLAVIVGSAAALATNDSGIVAAATMMIFAAAPLMYIAINNNNKGDGS